MGTPKKVSLTNKINENYSSIFQNAISKKKTLKNAKTKYESNIETLEISEANQNIPVPIDRPIQPREVRSQSDRHLMEKKIVIQAECEV